MMDSYYDEALKASGGRQLVLYQALADIVQAYDAYRARGAIPAPELYANLVKKIDDARSILRGGHG